MSGFKGDFLGFTYNGVHSSDLGIVRTSDGSRFNENLLPTIQDKTVQVPGGDGTYYFGSYYTQRQFSIPFAFDSLTDIQVRQLRAHFGDKKIHELVFDEAPYKTYRAKVTGTAQIKHIVFNEGEGMERVYKGEGSIQFTCYDPYAICKKKTLDSYEETNKGEWANTSRLKSNLVGYDTLPYAGNVINLYNPGDLPAHFSLLFFFYNNKIAEGTIAIDADRQLAWREMVAEEGDCYVGYNSRLNLLEGYDQNGKKTGHVYNQYITSGQFFTIPVTEPDQEWDWQLTISGAQGYFEKIEYYYYYI